MPLPVAALAIPALASAASNLLGGLIGKSSSSAAADRMIEFAREQREYNDPLNARQRLERAGFNPMTYGQPMSVQSAGGTPELSQVSPLQQGVSAAASSLGQIASDVSALQSAGAQQVTAAAAAKNAATNEAAQHALENLQKSQISANEASAATQQKLAILYDEEATNEMFKRNWMDKMVNSQIRVNDQQASLVAEQVKHYGESLAIQWMNAKANALNADTAKRSLQQTIDAWKSNPNNTWFRSLPRSQQKVVEDALHNQILQSISTNMAQLRKQLGDVPWVDNAYYRVVTKVINPLTSSLPAFPSSPWDAGKQSHASSGLPLNGYTYIP